MTLWAEISESFDLVIFSFITRSLSAWGLLSARLIWWPVLEVLSRLLSVCCAKQCVINELPLFLLSFFVSQLFSFFEKCLSGLNGHIQRSVFA